ncbi:MAG TPA: hypothetical protein VII11_11660 [Bacteroidota bacterium]
MATVPHTIPIQQNLMRSSQKMKADRILIFSPDADLAVSLKLLLEVCCEVVIETRLERLEGRMRETPPSYLLVDLFSTAQDGLKQLQFLERLEIAVPVILLRTYRSSAAIDEAIKNLRAYVFYKPVNVETVVELIHELQNRRKASGERGTQQKTTSR